MHIRLNAHLLSGAAGYRSAGIHQYIDGLLRHLADHAPADWRLTAHVGAQVTSAHYPRVEIARARWNTESPARRIAWEQVIQPFALGAADLHHALAFVAPVINPAPTVVTVYDLSFIHYPERLPASRRAYLRALTERTCQRAARVIAISHSTARDLTATLGIPAHKIDVAQPGYDSAHMRPLNADAVRAFRMTKQLPDRFWLFIGTLEPRKNLVLLLEAYAALKTRLPLIIGGGKGWDYEAIFDAHRRLNLGDAVQFVGFIPPEELALWYNSAEVFIYPSVFEGFGLPPLEALACGTPVIVSDVSSLPEVVGDAGVCVPPGDREAWIAALERAEADSVWRDQARTLGLAQAARFSWSATARRTIASYQQALDGVT